MNQLLTDAKPETSKTRIPEFHKAIEHLDWFDKDRARDAMMVCLMLEVTDQQFASSLDFVARAFKKPEAEKPITTSSKFCSQPLRITAAMIDQSTKTLEGEQAGHERRCQSHAAGELLQEPAGSNGRSC